MRSVTVEKACQFCYGRIDVTYEEGGGFGQMIDVTVPCPHPGCGRQTQVGPIPGRPMQFVAWKDCPACGGRATYDHSTRAPGTSGVGTAGTLPAIHYVPAWSCGQCGFFEPV